MDGIHDLGGMDGFGPVPYSNPTETFHERWHGEMYAALLATLGNGISPIDRFRHSIERMPPDLYLESAYYDRWVTAITRLYVESGLVDPETFAERTQAIEAGGFDATEVGDATPVDLSSYTWVDQKPDTDTGSAEPAFEIGDRVVVRNDHPEGHTRSPRYARRACGEIEDDRGLEPFPDARAHGRDESKRLYRVAFEGRELWGEDAEPGLSVTLDLWEPYLRPADSTN